MRDNKKLLRIGNKAQLEKLNQNNHKGDFETQNYKYYYKRLTEELQELSEEIFCKNPDFDKIRLEAADVANFAHMIIFDCETKRGLK